MWKYSKNHSSYCIKYLHQDYCVRISWQILGYELPFVSLLLQYGEGGKMQTLDQWSRFLCQLPSVTEPHRPWLKMVEQDAEQKKKWLSKMPWLHSASEQSSERTFTSCGCGSTGIEPPFNPILLWSSRTLTGQSKDMFLQHICWKGRQDCHSFEMPNGKCEPTSTKNFSSAVYGRRSVFKFNNLRTSLINGTPQAKLTMFTPTPCHY